MINFIRFTNVDDLKYKNRFYSLYQTGKRFNVITGHPQLCTSNLDATLTIRK